MDKKEGMMTINITAINNGYIIEFVDSNYDIDIIYCKEREELNGVITKQLDEDVYKKIR